MTAIGVMDVIMRRRVRMSMIVVMIMAVMVVGLVIKAVVIVAVMIMMIVRPMLVIMRMAMIRSGLRHRGCGGISGERQRRRRRLQGAQEGSALDPDQARAEQ